MRVVFFLFLKKTGCLRKWATNFLSKNWHQGKTSVNFGTKKSMSILPERSVPCNKWGGLIWLQVGRQGCGAKMAT